MLKTKFILNPTHRKLFISLFNRHSRSHLKPPTMKLYFLLHLIQFLIHASIPPLIFFKSITMLKLNLQCSVIIQNITHHSATLTPGYIGYIEVPATNIQPSRYKVNDVNSLIHSVFHSYYPDLSEPKPPRRRSSLRNPQIEINNLQPSQILKRPLPPLPYSPDTQQFLNKFKFHYSDVSDEESLQLCSILVKYRTCYATHKNDVGQIATPFRIRLKPNAKLQTQRPTKVPIHYREKLKKTSR